MTPSQLFIGSILILLPAFAVTVCAVGQDPQDPYISNTTRAPRIRRYGNGFSLTPEEEVVLDNVSLVMLWIRIH